jgi:hypothetical protein
VLLSSFFFVFLGGTPDRLYVPRACMALSSLCPGCVFYPLPRCPSFCTCHATPPGATLFHLGARTFSSPFPSSFSCLIL